MANVIFGTPFYSDVNQTYTPTFSAGTWSSTLPLTNLQDRRLAKVARSSAATTASTQFIADLITARAVRVFALPTHNFTINATVRIRGSANADGITSPVYDSGVVNVFPAGAAITAEELAEQRALGFNFGFTNVASAAATARYWKFEISDTGNAAGYVELGRVVIAGAWQPTINMEYGAKLGWETSSSRTETDGGAAIYNERVRRRTFSCVIGHLPEAEALENPFDIQRDLGTTKQLMFVFDPDDTTHMHRRSFLAVMKELSALDFPYYGRNTVPIGLIEEL